MHPPTALFILGHAGTGKSFLTHHFVAQQREKGRAWGVLDKDVVSENWSGRLLEALGQAPNDRDSPLFKEKVRDLEYLSTLRIARDQLALGLDVVFPGPWSRELASLALFSTQELGFSAQTRLRHVWLELSLAVRKERLIARADPRDQWKLDHWEAYVDALKRPAAVQNGSIPIIDANLPLAEQIGILDELVR